MANVPWRFQADIAPGETDPVVTVFMGDTYVDEESGQTRVRQDTVDPVTMKLSELKSALHLADPKQMGALHHKQKQERAALRKNPAFDPRGKS
jgi:hypothetical protein